MNTDQRNALVTRDAILKLLSDQETESVSTAETQAILATGDEYLDLEHLEQGVRKAAGAPVPMSRILARKAVHQDTWKNIMNLLSPKHASARA
jgi:hypothetical protein